MERFNNKYRIASTRLQNWDYRWTGAYFITICTQNREHYFGHIVDRKMQLSHVGIIADILWHQIPRHSQHVQLGAFVVMPNHIHGILIITDNTVDTGNVDMGNVETGHALSLPPPPPPTATPITPSNALSNTTPNVPTNKPPEPPVTIGQKRFQNIGKNSISSIVGSYKSAVSKNARRLQFDFQWQSLFYDHVIRDDQSFQRISSYIKNNPANWREDKFCISE